MDNDKAWTDISQAVRQMSDRERTRYAVQFPAMMWHYPVVLDIVDSKDAFTVMPNFSIN